MGGSYQMSFAETSALIAVMSDNRKYAIELLRGLLPSELRALDHALIDLSALVHAVQIERAPGETQSEKRNNWLNGKER